MYSPLPLVQRFSQNFTMLSGVRMPISSFHSQTPVSPCTPRSPKFKQNLALQARAQKIRSCPVVLVVTYSPREKVVSDASEHNSLLFSFLPHSLPSETVPTTKAAFSAVAASVQVLTKTTTSVSSSRNSPEVAATAVMLKLGVLTFNVPFTLSSTTPICPLIPPSPLLTQPQEYSRGLSLK